MITLVPEGGLCNRMRAVAAAALLARRADQPLRVIWYRTPDFNARFDALFQAAPLPFAIVERWAMVGAVRDLVRLSERMQRLLGMAVVSSAEATPDRFDAERVAVLARTRPVYIRSFARFLSEPGMFQIFEPVRALQRRVDALQPGLARAIGVHIRRTDNKKAIEMSPLSSFLSLMEREVDDDAAARFFVATDSPETHTQLRDRFGDRVFHYEKRSLRRDDPDALADAVVDLYALGSCRKIIGSYWSSFTDTAAELRGIDRIVARSSA